jgi:hypothetical protein
MTISVYGFKMLLTPWHLERSRSGPGVERAFSGARSKPSCFFVEAETIPGLGHILSMTTMGLSIKIWSFPIIYLGKST